MTKEEVENVIKRYSYIAPCIKKADDRVVFYTGKRRHVVEINDEIKIICEIIEIVYAREKEDWVRIMIKGILRGDSDVKIMNGVPGSRNFYYAKKTAFFEKIYECCIVRGLVTYEEILGEEIA